MSNEMASRILSSTPKEEFNMSVFGDEDLKKLKNGYGQVLTTPMLEALIERLEAAEAVLNGDPHEMDLPYPDQHCKSCELIRAWRKSCGRKP